MKPLTCIVAAIDFSGAADRAALRAALIARQEDAELHLLHVVSPLALYPGQEAGPLADELVLAAVGERLEATARVLRTHYGIRVRVAQRIGRPHGQIADYAASVAADLVVAGARGQNTLLRLLLGSTAWRLLRVCKGPVLVVRTDSHEPYRRALAAMDFSSHSSLALAWASRLVAGGHLDVLHVQEPEDEDRLRRAGLDSDAIRQRREERRAIAADLMAKLQIEAGGTVEKRVETGYPPEQILERAGDWHDELIVLGRHGKGGLEEYLLGSVSKDVAQAADCDVLLVGGDADTA